MTTLLPTLRERGRYIVFEMIEEKGVEIDEFIKALNHNLNYYFGVVLTSRMSVWVMKQFYDKSRGVGIIKTNSESTEYLRFALISLTQIEGKEVAIRIRGISGTLKGARIKYLYLIKKREA